MSLQKWRKRKPIIKLLRRNSGGRAHTVGVVSRGGECAGFNQPGIYTNLMDERWNKWVRENIKEGDC